MPLLSENLLGAVTALCRLVSDYNLTNTASLQKAFNASPNGAVAVEPNTTYEFEAFVYLTSMSGSSGNFSFDILGAGSATLNSVIFDSRGLDNSTPTTPANGGGCVTVTNVSASSVITAGTGTAAFARIEGLISVNTAGTIIPSIALANAAAAVMKAGSHFKMRPLGAADVTLKGSWS